MGPVICGLLGLMLLNLAAGVVHVVGAKSTRK